MRIGRVLAVTTVVCAATWLVAVACTRAGQITIPRRSRAGRDGNFPYLMLLLVAGTLILADWLNKQW